MNKYNQDLNNLNNLNELKNYLINNYQLDEKINININYRYRYNKSNIKIVYSKILFLLVLLVLLFIIFRNNKNKIINILYTISIVIILIFIIFYLYVIYFYNKFINNYDFKYYDNNKYENYINYTNDIDLNTGDIIQEYLQWYHTTPLMLNYKYGHNFIILKFNKKKYMLHFSSPPSDWPKYVLYIKSRNLEISCLDSYLKNNIYTRYYRLFRTKTIISNDNIFNYLKYITSKKISFSFCNIFNIYDNTYQCMSFILNLLYYLDIIPKFNFNYFIPDNLIFLPNLSNKLYDTPVILHT